MSLLLALLAAAPAPAAAETPMPPPGDAAPAAIVAGAKACIGTVTDPAGISARFAGWSDGIDGMSADDIKGMKAAGGRAYSRDNVRVALQPGAKGGCVVIAGNAAGLDKPALLSSLGKAIGVPVSTSGLTTLPNGEVMSAEVGERMAFILVTSRDQAKAQGEASEH